MSVSASSGVLDEPVQSGMFTVLFVEDDEFLLDELRRATHRLRHIWNLYFAASGQAALELLAQLPRLDVIVTDMRMPGMDGADLLVRVRDRSPATSRIIMSDQWDLEAVYRGIGPAHQHLAKPCEVTTLVQVIARLVQRPSATLHEPVRTVIGEVDRLPTQPAHFQRLTQEIEDPNSNVFRIATIVAEDVALTTELLRVVNSAFFGVYGVVESVDRAVSLLGANVVRGIVLGAELFRATHGAESWLDLDALGRRSQSVAFCARGLALRAGAKPATAALAFLSGMVSEVGLLVLARSTDVRVETIGHLNEECDLDYERAIFGGDRFRVGSELLRLWGFGQEIVDAVGDLSNPMPAVDDDVAWYLRAARHLAFETDVDPSALADPSTPIPPLDAVLDHIRRHQPVATHTTA
jgi:HD-like signal output (HDOD) protein/CheY-like chemotaxis protein